MPARKSSRKRTTAKKSAGRKAAAKKSTARKTTARKSARKTTGRKPARKTSAKKTAAKKSSAKKSAGKRSTAKRSKKSPVAKMIKNPKQTARTAVKIARKTVDATRDVGETMVGASEVVKKAIDAVDTIVSSRKRRSGRSRKSGEPKSN